MKKYILFFLLLVPLNALTQKSGKEILNNYSNANLKKDTIYVVSQEPYQRIAENYQEILEKTNNQLGLWTNPYGVIIASLTALFTILTIIAAVIIYYQSKDSKKLIRKSIEDQNKKSDDLIEKSLKDHKDALDKLIFEKNEQFKNYEINLNRSIEEYKDQLRTSNSKNQKQINQMIAMLEDQKAKLEIPFQTYKHFGWDPMDIPLNYPIDQYSSFKARIILNKPNQEFIIYIRVVNNENKKFWIGFGGKDINAPIFDLDEFTQYKFYNTSVVTIDESIYSLFKYGFPNVRSLPIVVDCVRLRGSIKDNSEISFNFKIS